MNKCVECGEKIEKTNFGPNTGGRRKETCSDACRQRRYRRLKKGGVLRGYKSDRRI